LLCALIGFCQCLPSQISQERVRRSLDVAVNVVEGLESKFVTGTNITKNVIKNLKKKFEEFDALIKEADENIHVVQQDIEKIATKKPQFHQGVLDRVSHCKGGNQGN